MSPVTWVWGAGGPPQRTWAEDCPAGAPVPGAGGCPGTDCDSIRLTALAEGCRGRVTCLEDAGGPEAVKLAAMGVLPGADLVLVQRFPAFVFRIGRAEFAVDDALARLIRLRPA